MKIILRIVCLVLFLLPLLASAGKKDTLRPIPDPIHNNVIKLNPTVRNFYQLFSDIFISKQDPCQINP